MAIPTVDVNFVAVLVAAIVSMIIGALWYSPLLFGKLWMRLSNITAKQLAAAKKKNMTAQYIGQFVLCLVTAYVLTHFLAYVGATSVSDAVQLGFWIWLGFVGPVTMGMVLWMGKSFKLFLLDSAHNLVTLLAMGIVLLAML